MFVIIYLVVLVNFVLKHLIPVIKIPLSTSQLKLLRERLTQRATTPSGCRIQTKNSIFRHQILMKSLGGRHPSSLASCRSQNALCARRSIRRAVTSYLGHLVISPPFRKMRSAEMSRHPPPEVSRSVALKPRILDFAPPTGSTQIV